MVSKNRRYWMMAQRNRESRLKSLESRRALNKVMNGIGSDTKKPSRDEKVLSAFRIKIGRPHRVLCEPHQLSDFIKVNFQVKQSNSKESVDLYKKGLSLRDIGKELNISKNTVRNHLIKAGVELSPKDPSPAEVSRWRTRKTKIPPPFGYCYFQGRLVENPIEYDVLLKIHRQWKEGRDANEITRYLNANKLKPRKAKAWHNKAVKKIVARFASKQIIISGEET